MTTQSLWAANALWAGQAIAERLREQVAALREVLLLDEIDGKTNGPRQTPAAVVLLDRMVPVVGPGGQQLRTAVRQDWIVALGVRAAAPDANRNAVLVGQLIPPVVTALQGWVPPGQLRAFAWVPGMRPDYGRDISYYPLVFQLQVVTA